MSDSVHKKKFHDSLELIPEEYVGGMARKMASDSLGLTDKEIEVVEFIFWMSARVENLLGEILQIVFCPNEELKETLNPNFLRLREEILKLVTDDLYLGGKAKLMSRVISSMSGKKPKEIEEFLQEINRLRNDISHNRFRGLRYRGKELIVVANRKKMIADYKSALDAAFEEKKSAAPTRDATK